MVMKTFSMAFKNMLSFMNQDEIQSLKRKIQEGIRVQENSSIVFVRDSGKSLTITLS
jgi:hypothetical protein